MPLITITAPRLAGGIGRSLVNLADAWLQRGVDVDLVLDHWGDEYMDQLPAAITGFVSGGSNALTDLPWLVRYLRKRRPDALLTPVPRQTIWALRARWFARVPVTIAASIRSNYAMRLAAVSPRKRARRIALMRSYYPRCDAIVPISVGAGAVFSELTGIAPDSLTPIPNPAVTPSLYRLAQEAPAHAWFRDDAGVPLIIWVGRMEPPKNLPLMFDAFDHLRARMRCRLAIIGDGAERATAEAKASASPYAADITLLGHQPNPYGYMARSAVLALSSRWEGLANVLIEAMALGVPVAASDCPSGPAEILQHGRYGPLAPVDDAEALADAIESCLTNPADPETLRAAVSDYEAGFIANRYLQVLGIRSNGTEPATGLKAICDEVSD